MNALDRTFVSSGSSHCPLLNLSCDWFNYNDSLKLHQCVGNKGMKKKNLVLHLLINENYFLPVTVKQSLKIILSKKQVEKLSLHTGK